MQEALPSTYIYVSYITNEPQTEVSNSVRKPVIGPLFSSVIYGARKLGVFSSKGTTGEEKRYSPTYIFTHHVYPGKGIPNESIDYQKVTSSVRALMTMDIDACLFDSLARLVVLRQVAELNNRTQYSTYIGTSENAVTY